MSLRKKYKYNPHTLAYELESTSAHTYFFRTLLVIPLSLVVAFGYYLLYTEGLRLRTTSRRHIEHQYNEAEANLELLNRQLRNAEQRLEQLAARDNNVYRSVFGMEPISPSLRDAGFGGTNRYAYLDYAQHENALRQTALHFDKLVKKAYIQSLSFDEVERLSTQLGELANCIPSILPLPRDTRHLAFSSPYGYRIDPIYGDQRFHKGIDLAGDINSPVYATGNGVVESIKYEYNGYGRYVVINHGFGYKTRYAHLNDALVYVGQKVQRGERIGLMGNTGKSSGPHVHYEVLYMGNHVNPYNYFNNDKIDSSGYRAVARGNRH